VVEAKIEAKMNLRKLLSDPVRVKVTGRRGLFSRHDFPTERISYPIMTPSAARGLLRRIYGKPQHFWVIQAVQVLNPIRFENITYNEVRLPKRPVPVNVSNTSQVRIQRSAQVLIEPSYIIEARVLVHPYAYRNGGMPTKHTEQLKRRLKRGQFFLQPDLGKSEFFADCSLPDGSESPLPVSQDLGRIPLFVDQSEGRSHYFQAFMKRGVVQVPQKQLLDVLEPKLLDQDPWRT